MTLVTFCLYYNMNKGWTLIEVLVSLTIVLILAGFVAVIIFLASGCQEILDKGLKDSIEEVWEGKQ